MALEWLDNVFFFLNFSVFQSFCFTNLTVLSNYSKSTEIEPMADVSLVMGIMLNEIVLHKFVESISYQ